MTLSVQSLSVVHAVINTAKIHIIASEPLILTYAHIYKQQKHMDHSLGLFLLPLGLPRFFGAAFGVAAFLGATALPGRKCGFRSYRCAMSASYNNADQQQDSGASSADHNVLNALDTQDRFLPTLCTHRLMSVEFSFDRCNCRLGHYANPLAGVAGGVMM